MNLKLTHKQSRDVVLINTDNVHSSNDIIIGTNNPALLIAFTEALKTAITVNQNVPDYMKKYIDPDTNKLKTYSDEYLKEIFIPKYQDFFEIEIL